MSDVKELVIQISGKVMESNFDEYKKELIESIQKINKKLETDDDFIEAQDSVKNLKLFESGLIETKSDVLNQASEIQKLFDSIDEMTAEARTARLSLDKQIKSRKAQIKIDIVSKATDEIDNYYDEVAEKSRPFFLILPFVFDATSEFERSIKGLKTVKSMQDRIDDVMTGLKTIIDKTRDHYELNMKIIDRVSPENKSLFQDVKNLLVMDGQLLQQTIDSRITADELQKLKAEKASQNKVSTADVLGESIQNEPVNDPTSNHTHDRHNETQGQYQEPVSEPIHIDDPDCNFVISISMNCTDSQAKEMARKLFNDLESNDKVLNVNLSRV